MATFPLSPPPPHLFSLFSIYLMEPNTHLSIFSLLCLFLLFSLSIFLYRKKKKNPTKPISNHLSIFPFPLSPAPKTPHQAPSPLFVQILTSTHSPKWVAPNDVDSADFDGSAENRPCTNVSEPDLDADAVEEDFDRGGTESKGKRKKKRGRKKRQNPRAEDDAGREEEEWSMENQAASAAAKLGVECLYPFTSSSSVTQRKIKLHYDELVKSNEAKALTMAQIYKLEAEQKRLEEDAAVYNRLQEQLKLSPAYKKMLEIGARMELQASSDKLVESPDTEFGDISFEELLAQEKKDSFWQRNGKLRSCMS